MSQFMRWLRVVCAYWLQVFLAFLSPSRFSQKFGRRKSKANNKTFYRRKPKPEWVRKEVIRLKALMPEAGCRMIAHAFNRRFARSKQMTVSKTFVKMSLSLPHGCSDSAYGL